VAAIVVGVAAVVIILLVALLVRQRRRSRWWTEARLVAAEASALASAVTRGRPLLRDPNAAAQVWADLDGRMSYLRGRLSDLSRSAPDPAARTVTNHASQALETLNAAVDTDRSLRIGPPAPTPGQLAYSEALLRQRSFELEQTVRGFEASASTP
jgi:hypothetical protein